MGTQSMVWNKNLEECWTVLFLTHLKSSLILGSFKHSSTYSSINRYSSNIMVCLSLPWVGAVHIKVSETQSLIFGGRLILNMRVVMPRVEGMVLTRAGGHEVDNLAQRVALLN